MADRLPFGAQLRHYRHAAGLTQEELAERAGLSVRGLKYLEQGARRPYAYTVRRLAEALTLTARDRAAFEAFARVADSPPDDVSTGYPSLVGRQRELALLQRHLRGEGPPVLLLAGEPGIGKTRLLREAAAWAPESGLTLLEGGCHRRGGQEFYAPLLPALERRIRGVSPAQARTDLCGCAWLARLLPELAELGIEPLPAWALSPEQERRLVFNAGARFLSNVAGPAGTLLVLDDLHWASPDALDLLTTLMRSVSATPLRMVGAYRDTEAEPGSPLSVTLADLAQAGLAARHTVGPLAHDEADRLLSNLLADGQGKEPALRARVLRRAGGVPFFVVSCAQAMRTQGTDEVPWDLAQSIRQRLAALPEQTREVLGTAAVAGRVVEPPLLTALHGEHAVLDMLDSACGARLLVEHGDDAFAFAHDVVREVVEADLGPARRKMLHRRLAAALERDEAPVEVLAYHYARSDARDKAIDYLKRAGDTARTQHANDAAEGYYRALIERLDRLGRSLDAAAAREALGDVLFTVNRYDELIDALDIAAAAYQAAGDMDSLGRVVALIGWAHYRQGRSEVGLRLVREALAVLGPHAASHAAAELYLTLAVCLDEAGRSEEELAAAQRAADLATALDDPRLAGRAHSIGSGALFHLGRFEEMERSLEQARDLTAACGDLAELSHAFNRLALNRMLEGDFARAYEGNARAIEAAERLGGPQLTANRLSSRGLIETYAGRWRQARADVERAIDIMDGLGTARIGSEYCIAGQLSMVEGDLEAASTWLSTALALGEQSYEAYTWAQRLLAELDLLEGRPEAAYARIAPILASADQRDTAFLLPSLAWAHLQQGRAAEAAAVAMQAVERARNERNLLALADALRVQALAAMEQERWAAAASALDEGLALTRDIGYPYAEGRLLQVYGALHARTGEPALARRRLEEARDVFQRVGAQGHARHVERELLGLSPHAEGMVAFT